MKNKLLFTAALTIFILTGCGKETEPELQETIAIIQEEPAAITDVLSSGLRFYEYGSYEMKFSCTEKENASRGELTVTYDCDTMSMKGNITKNKEEIPVLTYIQDCGDRIEVYTQENNSSGWKKSEREKENSIHILNAADIMNNLIDTEVDEKTSEKEYLVSGFIGHDLMTQLFEYDVTRFCSLDEETLKDTIWNVILSFDKETQELSGITFAIDPETCKAGKSIAELCITITFTEDMEAYKVVDIPDELYFFLETE